MLEPRYHVAQRLYPYEDTGYRTAPPRRHPVVIVGAGPVGLALALDLGRRGTPVLVLDDHEGPGLGSKAICFAKRTLEIADRLGAADAMVAKGVQWNLGKVFHGNTKVFEFNLQPEDEHKQPAFINLQQPDFEAFLVDALRAAQAGGAPIELRGRNAVQAVEPHPDGVTLEVVTPDGGYQVAADWVIACDGARSPIRKMMGLGFEGRVFEDNFLIADVHMTADFPTERWFWFEPPFRNSGASALLHKQPDNIWRIDFQLGWDIDRDTELKEHNIRARVDAMLGEGVEYDLVWTSIYTFQCRRMQAFRHNRVVFAGDSAHQVSPFGARGANSGIQDAENLAWKLDLVLRGLAPDALVDSYAEERIYAADENILNSTRATDFLTPKTEVSRLFRNAVLDLAHDHAFARPLVNSGRLSVPCVYDGLCLNGPDHLDGPQRSRVGAVCPDVRLREGYLLERLTGGFTLLAINTPCPDVTEVDGIPVKHLVLETEWDSSSGALAARYLGDEPAGLYLIRPDQHIAARWHVAVEDDIAAALRTAVAKGGAACR